ncbi:hypothetical protein GCM10027037_32580 [Mucilaginibacter koreensis]
MKNVITTHGKRPVNVLSKVAIVFSLVALSFVVYSFTYVKPASRLHVKVVKSIKQKKAILYWFQIPTDAGTITVEGVYRATGGTLSGVSCYPDPEHTTGVSVSGTFTAPVDGYANLSGYITYNSSSYPVSGDYEVLNYNPCITPAP